MADGIARCRAETPAGTLQRPAPTASERGKRAGI